MAEPVSAAEAIRQLCLCCGICCSGILFRDVELQGRDSPARLRSLGLALQRRQPVGGGSGVAKPTLPASSQWKIPQPCPALGPDVRCRVYADRPGHCRAFECALFEQVRAGQRKIQAAQRVIRGALGHAERVRKLLCELGDTEESLALSLRFQRMQKAMNSRNVSDDSAGFHGELKLVVHELYAELTLAVHDLNLVLGREFHP